MTRISMFCDLNINKVYRNYICKKILNKRGYFINCFEADYQNKYDVQGMYIILLYYELNITRILLHTVCKALLSKSVL